jgi:multimeric flavodoxin WrbA
LAETNLTALALVCTLTPSPAPSSSELLAQRILAQLLSHSVSGDLLRIADYDVKPGVQHNMGPGDQWPGIRDRILAADILVLVTPIWMGHPSSLAQRVLERLDADLSATDPEGRPVMYGKVAIVGVVGNEDGAHKVTADLFQGLNDVGFTIPAQGGTYWVGQAMQTTDYKDFDSDPEETAHATAFAARNAAYLSAILKNNPYPAEESQSE